jgi:cytochrome c biogenesis factor
MKRNKHFTLQSMIAKENLPRTIGIVSGAVWANEAWVNYWSWDPKERHSEVTQE